ncbi:amidase family protein, partial [Streptomyces milbemycinicus]
AVAAGVVPLALGSQTAGSLTRPASYCGVAGYVAPVGAWSMLGFTGLSPSLDAPGLLATRVSDLARAVEAVDGSRA